MPFDFNNFGSNTTQKKDESKKFDFDSFGISPAIQEPSYLSRVKESIKTEADKFGGAITRGAELIQKGDIATGLTRGAVGTAAATSRAIFSPVTEFVSPLLQKGVEKVSDMPIVQKIATNKTVSNALDSIFGNVDKAKKWAVENPDTAANLIDAIEVASSITGTKGAGKLATKATPIAETAVKQTGKMVEKGIEKAGLTIEQKAITAQENLARNLNNIFDNSTVGVKKLVDNAKNKGIVIGDELVKREIMPKVENERMVFDLKDLDNIDKKEVVYKSRLVDEAIKPYANNIVDLNNVKKEVIRQIEQNPLLVREGRVDTLKKLALKKIDQLARGSDYLTIGQIQEAKKGMWRLTKKFRRTKVNSADAFSELGTTFRKIIEDEVPDINIHALNQEIGQAQELLEILNKVSGGVVLKGGKMGKYFETAGGMTVGGLLGAMSGSPLIAAAAAMGGKEISNVIRNLTQKSSILGPLDRILIRYAKKQPQSQAVKEALKYIQDIKNGVTPKISPRVEKTIKAIWEREIDKVNKQLLLPEGKSGAGTIELPPMSETARQQAVKQSYVKAVPAQKSPYVSKDPKTGKLKNTYLGGEAVKPPASPKLLPKKSQSLYGGIKAKGLIDDVAKTSVGKTVDYRSSHQIRDAVEIKSVDLDKLKEEVRSLDGYISNEKLKDFNNLKKLQSNPNATVKIYRASPVNELNSGDWVTTNKSYANNIKQQNGGKVYEYKVNVSDLNLPKDISNNPSGARFSAFQYNPKTASKSDNLIEEAWNKENKTVSKLDDLSSSIQKAKSEGKSFDEWVKGQGADKYVSKKLNVKDVAEKTFEDILIGKGYEFDFGGGKIVSGSMKETPNEIYLTTIGAKNKLKNFETVKGEGIGTQVVNTLKEYADLTGKKLIVPDATNKALSYWDRIPFLKRDYSIKMPDEGGKFYNPNNSYSYTPVKTRSQLKAEWDKIK